MTRRRWDSVHVADARQLGELLPRRECLDATITSPPYGALLDYGTPNQIGFGQSHEAYLEDMSSLFGLLWSRTKTTGSLWLIVDTFKERVGPGLGRVVPLPFQLASRAEECGWILQDVVIWEKDHTIPWSRRGQFRNSFEYVLFFVRARDFKYRIDRIKEVHSIKGWWASHPERYSPRGVTPSNIWRFPVPKQGSWSPDVFEHHCPLPPSLVARIVELSTDPKDVVCDPFVRRVTGAGVPIEGAIVRTKIQDSVEEQPFLVGSQKIHVYVPDYVDQHALLEQIRLLQARPPLSKFGISAEVRIRSSSEWRRPRSSDRWSRLRVSGTTPPELLNGQVVRTSIDDPPVLVDIDPRELAKAISAARELVGASP